MEWVPSNWRDIQRYFQNTWVKFPELGENTLGFVEKVSPKRVEGSDLDGEAFCVTLSEDAPFKVTSVLPRKRVFICAGKPYIIYRTGARQFFRGICRENVNVCEIFQNTLRQRSLTRDVLRALLKSNEFTSLKEAMFGKGTHKYLLLGERIWWHKPSQTICVDDKKVCDVKRSEKIIFHVAPLFRTELERLLVADPLEVQYEIV